MTTCTSPIKTDVNPQGIVIYFDEQSHTYWTDNRSEFVSATTFIKHYFPKFDAPAIALKKAMKDMGINDPNALPVLALRDQLLDAWDQKRDAAANMGTRVHENCEMQIQGKPLPHAPQSDRERSIMATAWSAVNQLLDYGLQFYAAEKIVFSERLSVAGTIDLLMHRDGVVWLLDWKTNERIDRDNNFGETALPPIETLPHCNYVHYSMQLSLYETLLRTQGYVKPGTRIKRMLIHLTPDREEFIPAMDMSGPVMTIAEHFLNNPWHLPF